jgi:hypothetical protein
MLSYLFQILVQWNKGSVSLTSNCSTYYVMKGLFSGVDGVVRGSALGCCNQTRVTLKLWSVWYWNVSLLYISAPDRGSVSLYQFTQSHEVWKLLPEFFHGFPQSTQTIGMIVLSWVFLPHPFRLTTHYHPLIWSCSLCIAAEWDMNQLTTSVLMDLQHRKINMW